VSNPEVTGKVSLSAHDFVSMVRFIKFDIVSAAQTAAKATTVIQGDDENISQVIDLRSHVLSNLSALCHDLLRNFCSR